MRKFHVTSEVTSLHSLPLHSVHSSKYGVKESPQYDPNPLIPASPCVKVHVGLKFPKMPG